MACEGVDERPQFVEVLNDLKRFAERSTTLTTDKNALFNECLDRSADRRPTDLELLAQLVFAWQARFAFTVLDHRSKHVGELLVKGARAFAYERRRTRICTLLFHLV